MSSVKKNHLLLLGIILIGSRIVSNDPSDNLLCDDFVSEGMMHLEVDSFRPVGTLLEDVHEGLTKIWSELRQDEIDVERLIDEAEFLISEVDRRKDRNYADTIRFDDKAYLLDMISRIDELINTLEAVDTKRAYELRESFEELRENLD